MYCSAPRPSDPFARFCNECGAAIPPLPTTRLPPADEGQVSMCVHCKSLVPMHAQKCIVCEAAIPQQKQPPAHVTGKTQQVCSSCGTVNPVGLDICVTCEARLTKATKSLNTSTSAPPLPTKEGCLLQCSHCSRINNSDARFCDWCGAKPKQTSSYITCSKCHASCHPYAKFCNSCGCLLGPPERLDSRNSNLPSKVTKALQQTDRQTKNDNQWMTVTIPPLPAETRSIHTQTQGLFYPSNKSISNQSNIQNGKEDGGIKEKKSLLSGVSPGKGFWRKQMDHICGHFRVHVQNNNEFRKIIGEPKLGKLLAATVHEDIDDMTISITYEVKQDKKAKISKIEKGLSSVTETEAKEKSSSPSKNKEKKKPTKAKGFSFNKKEVLSVENRILFKEVGPEGEGRIEEVQNLIEEGADPNCKNNDQIPVLAVAIQSRHYDCIPVLIQEGADVNAKVSCKGNTILHEAVQLGPNGIKAVEILLECGVDIKPKNGAGETAYDVAIKTSNDKAISLLASHSGKSLLDNLIKIK
ncbi:uncharacterized protein TRIADDRAFT_57181 [Trichoplax adhaerens]|uniref:DZANK-type domain-containing protein n=1 Tax=Trichoplax adhaerens TaxID=10228 RepID=B3S0V3_TRIAD|nr:hypothetical protein TRIADDRAFT_57181 [Trichoplax adhaerens]EDV24069.1 hypothetical protein TRIADDRAFT_57181 [Trichoplax adhaerens]|eukprot:XP_002113595.1 hypothetical protein TRIADDRAFT_57181 [Trichoplax adhaerens]